MEFRIDPHTLERARKRGASIYEIENTLSTGVSFSAKYGRLGKAKVYDFRQMWLGKYYEQKRVQVIYATEDNVKVTVTVYVFYGKWED